MKKTLAMFLALCMIFALCACGGTDQQGTGQSASAGTAADPGSTDAVTAAPAEREYVIEVLRLSNDGGDFGGPNPFRHSTRGPGSTKMRHVFDSLLQEGPDNYIPWLAETWSISDDNLVYTFTLHKDALWHDGEPVTANDVAFSIDYYAKNPNNGGNLFTADSSIIDHYEVTDDYTIVIYAARALSTNTGNIGTLPIIPKHIWENVDAPYNYDGDDKYIGCGMYKLVSYDSATGSYQFEANESYYGHKPAAHYIDYVPTSDNILAFENGDIAMTDVSADLYDAYAARDDIAMIPKNDEMGYRLMLNMDKVPALQDVEVRAAIYKALDRNKMVDSVFQGLGHVASAGYVPQTNPFYCDDVVKYDYDAEAAKEVLVPLGLKLRFVIGQDTPAEATLAELVKMDLEAVGVEVTVESYDVPTRDSMATSGDYDILLTYHGGWNAEPVSMLSAIYAGTPGKSKWVTYGYSNDELVSLIGSIPGIFDSSELKDAYNKAQLIISEDIPQLPLITQVSYAMYRPAEYDCWQACFNSTQFANCRLSYTSDSEF